MLFECANKAGFWQTRAILSGYPHFVRANITDHDISIRQRRTEILQDTFWLHWEVTITFVAVQIVFDRLLNLFEVWGWLAMLVF